MNITVKKEDKEMNIELRKPNRQAKVDAEALGAQMFKKLFGSDIYTRSQLNEELIKKGYWSKENQKRLEKITKELQEGEEQIHRGAKDAKGKKVSKDFVRKLAIDMRKLRTEQLLLLSKLKQYDSQTVEGKIEDAKFDYLLSECCFYDNGKRVFKDYDDYLAQADEDWVIECARSFNEVLYGPVEDVYKDQPENKFLIKYGFSDDKLRLINDEGQFVDEEGRLVNEDGRFIDKDGNYVDIDGNRVDEDGNPVVEFTEFDD